MEGRNMWPSGLPQHRPWLSAQSCVPVPTPTPHKVNIMLDPACRGLSQTWVLGCSYSFELAERLTFSESRMFVRI